MKILVCDRAVFLLGSGAQDDQDLNKITRLASDQKGPSLAEAVEVVKKYFSDQEIAECEWIAQVNI